jgi:K319-like protein/FG-GAP repeat protein/centrosomal CEP192-like protein/VCBS repeat protein
MFRQLLRSLFYLTLIFFLVAPVNAGAQVQVPDVKRIANPSPGTDAAFGKSVAGIGDVNGDGIGDLVIGAPGADKVYILSGKDQSLLRSVSDPDGLSKYQFGFTVVAVGDWDGDGFADFAVGAPGIPNVVPLPCVLDCKPDPQWGRVFVFSGATGSLIKRIFAPEPTLQFGYAIAPLGDLNGDGKQVLAIGAPVLGKGFGSVYAILGTDGTQIWKATESGIGTNPQPIASFGASLAVLHDINGDGKPDLLVGAPFHDDGTGKYPGAAYVLSGGDGTELRSHIPPQIVGDNRFGVSVANVADQNGDGVNDYIVGDPKVSKVYLFNGADGSFLAGIGSKQLNDSFGSATALVSDYDSDGVPDFFIAAPDGDRVYLMNKSGTELLHVANPAPDTHSFGRALSATRDLGGDSGLDLLIGAPNEVSGSGAAYLVTIRANKPPVANAGPDQLIECDRRGVVTLDGSASYDPDNDPITFQWKQVAGASVNLMVSGAKATFTAAPPGVYEFQLTVSDDKGASSNDNVVITIKDTKPPTLAVNLSPSSLWPPNHKMVDIAALIEVSDACDASPTVKLVSVVSNEPVNGTGDGNTSPDIAGVSYGTDDRSFQLRAERKGNGSGRIYTATYVAQDASGNSANGSGTVTVAHSYASISNTSINFAAVHVGSSSPSQSVTISNASPDPLLISSATLNGPNAGDFSVTENCSPSVTPDSSCSINVVFKPTSAGNRMASLLVSGSAINLPLQIALTGSGISATQDYNVTPSPNTATVKQGQSAQFTLTVTSQNGFNQALSFACSGLPIGANCLFSPASITPNDRPVTTILTVTTTAPSSRAELSRPNSNWLRPQGGGLVAALLFVVAVFLVPGLFRMEAYNRRTALTVSVVLLVTVLYGVGCASGGSSRTVTGGTPLGTAQFTVSSSATSGTAQHSITLSISVTQ